MQQTMKMQYLESLQAFVTTEIRIWDPSQPPIVYLGSSCKIPLKNGSLNRYKNLHSSPLMLLIQCSLWPLKWQLAHVFLQERRYGYHDDPQPWNKWDMLHIARYLLQNGARPSINHVRNSALACVLRHVTDWEFRQRIKWEFEE